MTGPVTVNLAGLPGISVPAGLSAQGTPLGLQLIGTAGTDEKCKLAEQHGDGIALLFTDVVMPGTVRSTELARRAGETGGADHVRQAVIRMPDADLDKQLDWFGAKNTERGILEVGRLDLRRH